ncbi:MAG TPA: ABC transporter substrate-binding protein [Rhodothermales bacterium]|nr:ABC transporter substrate-binding protein [Rhodothermales bacterium]
MSPRILRFVTTLLLAVAFGSPAASAQDQGSIRTLLLERDRDIKAVLARSPLSDHEKRSLRSIVNDLILFEEMGKTALGDYWTGLSEAQRRDFVETFSAIVREQSLADLDPYRARISIGTIAVEGTRATATTTALYKEVTTEVEYEMVMRDGQWWITDISLDGVSTAEGYARSFQTAIRKRGFDGLMESLRKRLDRITG